MSKDAEEAQHWQGQLRHANRVPGLAQRLRKLKNHLSGFYLGPLRLYPLGLGPLFEDTQGDIRAALGDNSGEPLGAQP